MFQKYLKEELNYINKELISVSKQSSELRNVLSDFLVGSSKCIRSIITLLYLKANNVKVSESSLKIIVAGEIIHNASLLHDDVIDNAKERRGQQSINSKYSSHFSIILGDYLLKFAIEKLLEVDNKEILNIFFNTIQNMCESEIKQFLSRDSKNDIEDYIKICKGKTASLFMAILKSCAIIEGIDSSKASIFAENFGVLFQLRNDLKLTSIIDDKNNKIYTARDIIGLDKTYDLIENYKEKIFFILSSLPNNIYVREFEDIIN